MIAENTTRATAPVPQWSAIAVQERGRSCEACGRVVYEGYGYGLVARLFDVILCMECASSLVATLTSAAGCEKEEERRPGELTVTLSWVPGDNLSMTDVLINRPQGAPSPGPWGDMSLLTVAVYRLQWYLDDYRDAALSDQAAGMSS